MLVMEPNVAWLLVTVLVAILFETTTLVSDCLLCQILLCTGCIWKIHGGGRHNLAGSSDGQVIWVARLSSKLKNRDNPLFNNNKKSFTLKHVCEKINKNKQCLLSWQTEEERISREEEWRWGVIRVTLMSLKSGNLNFCNVWRLFWVPRVYNGRDASLAVLSFFLVPFLILSEDSISHSFFIDQYLD